MVGEALRQLSDTDLVEKHGGSDTLGIRPVGILSKLPEDFKVWEPNEPELLQDLCEAVRKLISSGDLREGRPLKRRLKSNLQKGMKAR